MELETETSACLTSTPFIDVNHPSIVSIVERLGVADMAAPARAAALFRFVRDEIQYEFMAKLAPEDYVASHILRVGRGFCVQKAVLLAALGRAAGVPTALVLSDQRDHSLSPKIRDALGTNVMHHHGLVAFYLEGRWLMADASLSPDLVARKGYRLVEFDGRSEALQAGTTLSGAPHAEYLRFHGRYDELPFAQMIAAFLAAYGQADFPVLARYGSGSRDDV